ncbi:taurine ABC transporter substrate-binding protein [Cochlodiniinecator piscidefendens]|uniref:taurine ABC transporter substrate-binding protein n=1 Tax=Cochlodiniinecator piscidefendens TaxID=2715756 RepID=UPI00140D1D0C|nr:ABC transporter substrate-binding protein [Cochlodiniinecator piscidefendens]
MSVKSKIFGTVAGVAMLTGATGAMALDEITVAYFLEWPMPFEFAKANGTYDEELGVTVNWRAFDTGTAMSAAMASGDVHIAVSQGVPPFVVAASAGQDLQVVDVAVSYADNDNCVVHSSLEIDAASVADLEGHRIGVPIGTAAHYGFLKQMEHFGIDVSTLEVVDMAPADSAAALAQGSLDMACGWGGALRRMTEHGNTLLTGAEKTELGIYVFDVTSASASFVEEEPELLADFLAVTAHANAMWNSGEHTAEMLPVIAQDAGMSEEDAAATLARFEFPSVEAQLSEAWLGGGTQTFLKEVADFFVETGNIDGSRSSYDGAVNTSALSAASDM